MLTTPITGLAFNGTTTTINKGGKLHHYGNGVATGTNNHILISVSQLEETQYRVIKMIDGEFAVYKPDGGLQAIYKRDAQRLYSTTEYDMQQIAAQHQQYQHQLAMSALMQQTPPYVHIDDIVNFHVQPFGLVIDDNDEVPELVMGSDDGSDDVMEAVSIFIFG